MSTPEQRAAKAAYMREWTAKNRDRLNAAQRERYRANPYQRKVLMGRARMEKLRARGGVDEDTQEFVGVLLRDPCAYCGEPMAMPGKIVADGASLDHIDPGGDSHWTNLAGACSRCNASKGSASLLLSVLERRLRLDLAPIAEQLWLIKGRVGQRRRIEF